MSNTLRVPVTTYHEVKIEDGDLVELLLNEQKKLLPSGWDSMIFHKDSRVTLYKEGYGSHNVGEKEEEFHNEELARKYKAFDDVIKIIMEKVKK